MTESTEAPPDLRGRDVDRPARIRTGGATSAAAVRAIEPDELATWLRVVRTAMLSPLPSPDEVDAYRGAHDIDRFLAAVDGESRICGTARAFPTELTVPGGRTLPAGAVSSVGVLPTHRRQGHLSRMMHAQLRNIADRGEPLAVLIAAEYPIYGRYGYGPATEACAVELDADPGAWRDQPTGHTELVDGETLAPALVELYDRARRRHPGHITWDKQNWAVATGAESWPDGEDDERRRATKVLWRDAEGTVQGAAIYRVDGRWTRNRPDGVLHAGLVVAATDEAHREVVRFLTTVDWVGRVHMGLRPVDDPVPLWLRDGRAATLIDRSDQVWVRILDLPRALTGRGYDVEGRLVLDVTDPLGHAGGRYLLEAGPYGATCHPTTADADLVLPVSALGAAYLGGYPFGRLAAAGMVEERHPGAVARATALFAAPRAPWCPRTF